jgi:hypothetical protein
MADNTNIGQNKKDVFMCLDTIKAAVESSPHLETCSLQTYTEFHRSVVEIVFKITMQSK